MAKYKKSSNKLLKIVLLFSLFIIISIFLSIFYLSNYGIKTTKFNNLILERIIKIDPRLSAELKDVFLKLDLNNKEINVNTKNTVISLEKNSINFSDINIKIDLISVLKNKPILKSTEIETKENSIKNIFKFVNSYKFNVPLFIIFTRIEEGSILVNAKINFDKNGKIDSDYKIIGRVNNSKFKLFNNETISNINFHFDFFDNNFNFKEINLEYLKTNLNSNIIKVTKNNNNFDVKGDVNNKSNSIDLNKILSLVNIKLDFIDNKKINIETNNNFAFVINDKNKVKNLSIFSNLNFKELYFNKKYKSLIYLENGNIKTEYSNNNLSIDLKSKYSFIDDDKNYNKAKDEINLKIVKKDKDYFIVEGDFKNKKKSLESKVLFDMAGIKDDLLSDKKISIESDNKFAFKINNKKNIKDLEIRSNLKFDKIFLNEKYKSLIYLENGNIETLYTNNNLSVKLDSKYSFVNERNNLPDSNKDNLKLNIYKKKNEDYLLEGHINNKKRKIDSNILFSLLNIKYDNITSEQVSIESNNKFSFKIDKNEKIQDLKIKSKLKYDKLNLSYKSDRIKKYLTNYNNLIYTKNGDISLDYYNNTLSIKGTSEYSLDKKFDNFKFDIKKNKNEYKFDTVIEINNNPISLKAINYNKKKNVFSSAIIKGEYFEDEGVNINQIKFNENDNFFEIINLQLDKDLKIINIDEIKTSFENIEGLSNNIKFFKKNNDYNLKGSSFDFSNYLNEILKSKNDKQIFDRFKNLNTSLNVDIDKVYLSNKSYLTYLNGELHFKNNKITEAKLNSNFPKGGNFFFSINSKNNQKITTLYSENAEPFVQKFNFVKGFTEGRIDFNSIKSNNISNSTIKIYNFKLKQVPLLTKLLSLASLQGIADLMTGEGIRFDELEMSFKNEKQLMIINEMYAIGPAISILMEGYVEKDKLVSLRGTLVPATTINKSIAKIPLLGGILVGKKVGEGVFGVSFKIKGPPKNLKTLVNPIKTLTPRFITRTLEKLKKS